MSLGASVAMTNAAERAAPFTMFADTFDLLMHAILAPAGEPISPPIPRAKPETSAKAKAKPAAKPAPGIVAQCGYATVVADLSKDGKTPLFRVTFAEGMADEMVMDGCARFFQGCNVCNVRYEGCTEAERGACTDAACLEKTCERKVICSAKTCTAQGRAPTCESRLTRTQCMQPLFE